MYFLRPSGSRVQGGSQLGFAVVACAGRARGAGGGIGWTTGSARLGAGDGVALGGAAVSAGVDAIAGAEAVAAGSMRA